MRPARVPQVEELHAQFDANRDGMIDFDEFKQVMISSGMFDDDGSLADRVAIAKVASEGKRAAAGAGKPGKSGSRSKGKAVTGRA